MFEGRFGDTDKTPNPMITPIAHLVLVAIWSLCRINTGEQRD